MRPPVARCHWAPLVAAGAHRYMMPRDVTVVILFAERGHFGYDTSAYAAIQGFDRFVEGGLGQIDEPAHVQVPRKKSATTAPY